MLKDVKKRFVLVCLLLPLLGWGATDTVSVTITIREALTINSAEIPTQFRLYPPYPNPFNSTVILRLDIPQKTIMRLEIFDLEGRLIQTLANNTIEAGRHHFAWRPANQISSGLYLMVLRAPNYHSIKKIIYLK